MDQRALILHHLTDPTGPVGTSGLAGSASLDERTVERLYGLCSAHPASESHDVGAVADALRRLDAHRRLDALDAPDARAVR